MNKCHWLFEIIRHSRFCTFLLNTLFQIAVHCAPGDVTSTSFIPTAGEESVAPLLAFFQGQAEILVDWVGS